MGGGGGYATIRYAATRPAEYKHAHTPVWLPPEKGRIPMICRHSPRHTMTNIVTYNKPGVDGVFYY